MLFKRCCAASSLVYEWTPIQFAQMRTAGTTAFHKIRPSTSYLIELHGFV